MASNSDYNRLDSIRSQLKRARITLTRLQRHESLHTQEARDKTQQVRDEVTRLENERNDLYTRIGRRKKQKTSQSNIENTTNNVAQPEAPTERECPICLQRHSDEELRATLCDPVTHFLCFCCWVHLSPQQKQKCVVCRQKQLSESQSVRLYCRFPSEVQEFDAELFLCTMSLDWFNSIGKSIAIEYSRGKMTNAQIAHLTISERSNRFFECVDLADLYGFRADFLSGGDAIS